jgi:phosphohistidine swiveling domain-containing protein
MVVTGAPTELWEFDSEPRDGVWYSRFNVQEMCPTVTTPLSWSTSWQSLDRGAQRAHVALGLAPRVDQDPFGLVKFVYARPWYPIGDASQLTAEVGFAGGADRLTRLFGAPLSLVEQLDRGGERAGAPDRRDIGLRLPVEVARMVAMAGEPMRSQTSDTIRSAHTDWQRAISTATVATIEEAFARMADARVAVEDAYHLLVGVSTCAGIVLAALIGVLERAGVRDPDAVAQELLSGTCDCPSADAAEALWDVQIGALSRESFDAMYGYRGLHEVELRSLPWRLDDDAVRTAAANLAAIGVSPAAKRAEARSRAHAAESRLAEMSSMNADDLQFCLDACRRFTAAREQAKAVTTMRLDEMRALVRRLGEVMSLGESLWYLTLDEVRSIADGHDVDVAGLAASREQELERLSSYCLPEAWVGYPARADAVLASSAHAPEPIEVGRSLEGYGVCPGVVDGRVRIVLDPYSEVVAAGEVLVASTTDAAWTAHILCASAVVVDYGSRDSHAAIVAREFGVPTIVNVRTATRDLRDGDLVRVDGTTGTLTLLARLLAPDARPSVLADVAGARSETP